MFEKLFKSSIARGTTIGIFAIMLIATLGAPGVMASGYSEDISVEEGDSVEVEVQFNESAEADVLILDDDGQSVESETLSGDAEDIESAVFENLEADDYNVEVESDGDVEVVDVSVDGELLDTELEVEDDEALIDVIADFSENSTVEVEISESDGEVVNETEISGDGVEVESFEVTAGNYSVTVDGDRTTVDDVDAEVDDGVLFLPPTDGSESSFLSSGVGLISVFVSGVLGYLAVARGWITSAVGRFTG